MPQTAIIGSFFASAKFDGAEFATIEYPEETLHPSISGMDDASACALAVTILSYTYISLVGALMSDKVNRPCRSAAKDGVTAEHDTDNARNIDNTLRQIRFLLFIKIFSRRPGRLYVI